MIEKSSSNVSVYLVKYLYPVKRHVGITRHLCTFHSGKKSKLKHSRNSSPPKMPNFLIFAPKIWVLIFFPLRNTGFQKCLAKKSLFFFNFGKKTNWRIQQIRAPQEIHNFHFLLLKIRIFSNIFMRRKVGFFSTLCKQWFLFLLSMVVV